MNGRGQIDLHAFESMLQKAGIDYHYPRPAPGVAWADGSLNKIYVDPEQSGYGTWFYFNHNGDLVSIESIY